MAVQADNAADNALEAQERKIQSLVEQAWKKSEKEETVDRQKAVHDLAAEVLNLDSRNT